MIKISRLLMAAALAGSFITSDMAAETVIYDLRVSNNFDPSTQFAVGHDRSDYIWKWARYSLSTTDDASGPEMFNSNQVNEPYYEDIFMTKDLDLQPGVTYSVVSRPRCRTSNATGKLTLLLGQGTITESVYDKGGLTTLGIYTNIPYVNTYSAAKSVEDIEQIRCDFTVPTAGKYKVCFFGEGYALTLHDTYIAVSDGSSVDPDPDPEPVPDPVVPSAVSGLEADVDGLNVTLSFSLPLTSTEGEGLDGKTMKYTIYRDGEQIATKSRQNPGDYITYVDSEVAPGTYVYGVDVTLGEETSERATVEVTVNKPIEIPDEQIALPVSDSFAGGAMGTHWYVEETAGKGAWAASSEPVRVQMPPYLSSWDGDDGVVVYDGWNAGNGDYARLSSVPITAASSMAPVVDFMFGHSYSRACTNYVQVQVSKDGGPWVDVDDARIVTYIPELEDGGWVYYKFALSPYIQDCDTYRVGFLGVNEGLSTYLPLDAINIYNASEKEVALESVVVPAEVHAGNDIVLNVTIDNRGSLALSADDYSIEVETDFPAEVLFDKVEIPAYASATVSAKVPVTAEEVLDGPEYTFAVTLNVPGNEGEETMSADAKTVKTLFVEHKNPANAVAVMNGDTLTGISWLSVKDLDHKNINISENFNDLPARRQEDVVNEEGKLETVWVDGAKGDFNGFVSLDFDKQAGSTWYSTSGSEFQVFKDFMTGSMPQGHSGQYIGLTHKANTQQDDWLISPALDAAESSLIKYWIRIAYIVRESDSYNNSLEVLYSTKDYDKKNPSDAFTKLIYSNTSKASSGDLPHDGLYHWLYLNEVPAEAKYIAVHFNTKSGMDSGVWVDRISITEADQHPLTGYYVYRRNQGRLNAEPLDKTQLSYALAGASLDMANPYYVTALYEDGESLPSNMVGKPASVLSPASEDVEIHVIKGGVMVNGTDQLAEVFTLDGKRVASVKTSGMTIINLESGLYVVKAGDKTLKAIVK